MELHAGKSAHPSRIGLALTEFRSTNGECEREGEGPYGAGGIRGLGLSESEEGREGAMEGGRDGGMRGARRAKQGHRE